MAVMLGDLPPYHDSYMISANAIYTAVPWCMEYHSCAKTKPAIKSA